ncbi:hypothetical protein [Methanopyrus kandleri]|uniref:hypothetical protein n=1 Tax=Methanopyrus kandleri TaxID=2320 RepID=UPI0011E57D5E|nr:hypothetical protein [Methanopyrus kandleri]
MAIPPWYGHHQGYGHHGPNGGPNGQGGRGLGPEECPYGHPKCPSNSPATDMSGVNVSSYGGNTTGTEARTEVPVSPGSPSRTVRASTGVVSDVKNLAYASWPVLSLLGLLIAPTLVRR